MPPFPSYRNVASTCHAFHSTRFLTQARSLLSLCTVPLNCNFIFTRVITRGTTAILQCIPVACLRGPRLVVSCNVHVSWKLTRGSVRLVEAHAWKCTSRGSSRVEVYVSWKLSRGSVRLVEAQAWNKTRMHVKTYLPSLSHYITPIFCWFTSTMSRIDSSVAHI